MLLLTYYFYPKYHGYYIPDKDDYITLYKK